MTSLTYLCDNNSVYALVVHRDITGNAFKDNDIGQVLGLEDVAHVIVGLDSNYSELLLTPSEGFGELASAGSKIDDCSIALARDANLLQQQLHNGGRIVGTMLIVSGALGIAGLGAGVDDVGWHGGMRCGAVGGSSALRFQMARCGRKRRRARPKT